MYRVCVVGGVYAAGEELYNDNGGIACDVNEGSEDMQISKATRQGRRIRT
jgi:hypothetical protein